MVNLSYTTLYFFSFTEKCLHAPAHSKAWYLTYDQACIFTLNQDDIHSQVDVIAPSWVLWGIHIFHDHLHIFISSFLTPGPTLMHPIWTATFSHNSQLWIRGSCSNTCESFFEKVNQEGEIARKWIESKLFFPQVTGKQTLENRAN